MATKVTLQIPVEVHKDSVRVYRRPDVHLNVLFPGLVLAGHMLPSVLGPDKRAATVVREICEDISDGTVYVTCCGFRDLTMTAEEILESLGPGWVLVPQSARQQQQEPPAGD